MSALLSIAGVSLRLSAGAPAELRPVVGSGAPRRSRELLEAIIAGSITIVNHTAAIAAKRPGHRIFARERRRLIATDRALARRLLSALDFPGAAECQAR